MGGTSARGGSAHLLRWLQFVQEALSKNDTALEFESPTVNCSCNIQSLRTFLYLDNVEEELKNFDYHPDPSFNELLKNVITETSIIIVTVRTGHTPPTPGLFSLLTSSASSQGRGFDKAMTAKEAQAFVGDASCHVNILQVCWRPSPPLPPPPSPLPSRAELRPPLCVSASPPLGGQADPGGSIAAAQVQIQAPAQRHGQRDAGARGKNSSRRR